MEKEKHKLYTKRILKPNTKDARFIALQKTNQLENTIYLDQPKVSIEISNMFSRKIIINYDNSEFDIINVHLFSLRLASLRQIYR